MKNKKKKPGTTAETKRENKRKKAKNFEISIKEKQLNEKESKHKKRLNIGLELVQDSLK